MKPKIMMLGICSQCGNIVVRPPPCDVAICDCASAVEVQLTPYVEINLKIAKEILENPAIPIIILPKSKRKKGQGDA